MCYFYACVYGRVPICVSVKLMPTTPLNLTEGDVSERNATHTLFFDAQFYKKTKQLPILGKCCEEIQPHQWKPPVEREEHRLPFWLKVSLPPQHRPEAEGHWKHQGYCAPLMRQLQSSDFLSFSFVLLLLLLPTR